MVINKLSQAMQMEALKRRAQRLVINPATGKRETIGHVIDNLSEYIAWTPDRIARWLESIGE